MKKLSAIVLATLLAAPAMAQWQRTPTPNDTLQSVRRLADGSVVFSIYAPKARTVSVAGDCVPWTPGAQKVVEAAQWRMEHPGAQCQSGCLSLSLRSRWYERL